MTKGGSKRSFDVAKILLLFTGRDFQFCEYYLRILVKSIIV